MEFSGKLMNRRSNYREAVGPLFFAIILTVVFLVYVCWTPIDWSGEETKVVMGWQKTGPGAVDHMEQPKRRLPQAIIIGSRKSGTRALLKFLSANPNIRPANKEVHFFDTMHNYRLGLDWYREQMPLSLAHQITIEKSPAYFVTKGVPQRIRAMNSSVKLILVVRNPVTRLISDFSQLLAHKSQRELGANRDYDDYYHVVLSDETPGSSRFGWPTSMLEQIWTRAEASFESYVRRSDGGINEQRRAIKASMYSNYLEQWLGQFGRDQLHLVDGESLISDPASELRKVESFLGLAPVITRETFIFSQTKGFFCLNASSLSPPTPAGSDRRRKREAKQSTASSNLCLGNDKGRRHVKVRGNLTEELQQFYAPFNEYLYSLVGQNFNWSQVEIK